MKYAIAVKRETLIENPNFTLADAFRNADLEGFEINAPKRATVDLEAQQAQILIDGGDCLVEEVIGHSNC